jgi:SpoVK/Ycf46/Vps4 family AAA+-type ATPase
MLNVTVPSPDFSETALLLRQYAAYLPVSDAVDFDGLAARYRLLPGAVKRVLEMARMSAYKDGGQMIEDKDIVAGVAACRTNSLGNLGTLVPLHYGWEDLVTTPQNITLMKLAANHIKYRNIVGERWGMDTKTAYGRGICVLFYGAPGTGKTMAAQVLAKEVGMELFKVDASQLTSKYIGETSKNLGRVFDQMRGANLILFFDEADAIFGRRSDVKDSNDRYANHDTAFLLQKIEEYDGMTILSTNLVQNIDDAFRRRITYFVNFTFPDVDIRETIWRSLIPAGMPVGALDFPYLSSFEMTGSGIKSVITSAAYLAAGAGEDVSMEHMLRSLQFYMSKTGKTLSRKELAPYEELFESVHDNDRGYR